MSTEPETRTTACLLARGFNNRIRDHGPDGDYAGEPIETSDGHGFIVSRDGADFAVRVKRAQALAEPGPLTPGQCWAALKADVAKVLTDWQEQADGDQIPYAGAFVNAYAYVLQRMQELEAGP